MEENKILQLRRSLKMGRVRFARKCGVSVGTIVNAEKYGVRTLTTAERIATACDVNVSDLIEV